jgi:hypothetical protein
MTPTSGRAPDFLRIVERNPDLIFIIDHMGISEEIAKAEDGMAGTAGVPPASFFFL